MKSFKDVTKQLDEVLTKSTPAGEWIHDFVHSDNPKFKGKSAAKRKQMALAAYYAKKNEAASASQNSTVEVDMNESKDTSHVVNHDSEDVKASHDYVHKQAIEVAKRNDGKVKRHSDTHTEINYPAGQTTHIKTSSSGKKAVTHIKHHYSESVELDEDMYTSEYKIKHYVDPITGENKTRKIRPHRVDFKNSKMRGEPAQKDSPGDYGMKEDVNESRGHKLIASYFKNKETMRNIAAQTPEEKAEHEKKHREAMVKAHNEYVKKNPHSIFKPMKEEAEEVNEISKHKLVQYIDKATQDVHNKALEAGKDSDKPAKASDFIRKYQKSGKRQAGITKAAVKLAREEVEKWNVYDTKTNKVHSTHDSKHKAEKAYNQLNKDHEGYETPGGIVKGKYGMRKEEFSLEEDLDTAHIHQLLADKDINSQVKNGKVHVHSSNVKAAKMHLGAAGHKHEVVGGLNEDQEEDDRRGAEHHQQELETQEKESKKKEKEVKEELEEAKKGLWANIHAKRKRIAAGSGERMRKPGSKGAPSDQDLKNSQEEVEEGKVYDPFTKKMVNTKPIKVQAGGGATRNGVPVETGPSKYKEKLKEEQLDEISKKTLGSYIKKASSDLNKTARAAGSLRSKNDSDAENATIAADKRESGIKKAAAKLAKEEVESITELKKSTLASYIKKSKDQAGLIAHDLGHRIGSSPEAGTTLKPSYIKDKGKYVQRSKGINRAAEKLAKEEVEQIDEISKKTLGSYVKHASWDMMDREARIGTAQSDPSHPSNKNGDIEKAYTKQHKRNLGMTKAINRLTKEATEYKGIGTDVVDKKKVLNPPIPLTQKPKQVKDFKEGDEYDEKWKGYKGKSFKKESVMLKFNDFLEEAKKCMDESDCDYDKKMKKEELVGKQHKLDKNHNGKLDADDFKKLRNEGKKCMDEDDMDESGLRMAAHAAHKAGKKDFEFQGKTYPVRVQKEEVEPIEESYPTKQHFEQMAALIKSHDDMKKRSDLAHHHAGIFKGQNPRFDHKKFMHACGVHESAVCEEVEQIDELSKSTLASYIPKAAKSSRIHGMISKDYASTAERKRNPGLKSALEKLSSKYKSKAWDREDKIALAAKKLAKEEVEQIDELSKKSLQNYVGKALTSVHNLGYKSGDQVAKGDTNTGFQTATKSIKRQINIRKAVDKLAKEEVEQIDELSKKTLGSYAQAATMDAAKKGNEVAKLGNNLAALSHPLSPLHKLNKRLAGHAQAINKLTKEEVEQIDEISKKTLGSYVKGAAKDIADRQERIRAGARPNPGESQADFQKDMSKALALQSKRKAGMNKAVDKLTKEEVEQEMSPYVKGTLAVMDEGKIDDLRDAQALRKASGSSYEKELKPDTGHPHIKVVKGTSYGGENQKDDEHDEKSDNGEKRGRGRPSGSKSGAR